jgi:hypothetical protein
MGVLGVPKAVGRLPGQRGRPGLDLLHGPALEGQRGQITARYDGYARYQQRTKRSFPVVILQPR